MHTITEATTPADLEIVRSLFREYEAAIGVDLCFQGFEEELRTLPGKYAPPKGGLFIARIAGVAAGCVALRPLDLPGVAELKRLYVRSSARGSGLGLALTQTALTRAREGGYAHVRLDTLPSMQKAQKLYRELGFREIEPYTFNPVPGVTYMQLELTEASPPAHNNSQRGFLGGSRE
jgi:putative acetyltransferase